MSGVSFENDKLVEVKELGARQDERLLRVFQQLTKRIVKAEAEWPAKIHGPFLVSCHVAHPPGHGDTIGALSAGNVRESVSSDWSTGPTLWS